MDDRIRALEREVRLLRRYAAGISITLVLVFGLVLIGFRGSEQEKFAVLDVERLNIVEPDGTVRLAIANPDRLPPYTFKGKAYPGTRGGVAPGTAGMIYFNDEGTEMGGFAWSGQESPAGIPRAAGLVTFDHFNQNEAIALSYSDINGRRKAGLTVLDQPHVSIQPVVERLFEIMQLPEGRERQRRLRELREGMVERGEVGVTRLFVGRNEDKAAAVTLSDPAGRPRLRMAVDSLGIPRLEFLDEQGSVIMQLPEP